MKIRNMLIAAALLAGITAAAQTTRLSDGWKFAFGDASSPEKDFGRGTEYFNYLTKANSIHNEGPYSLKFNDSAWQDVTVPHDFVTTLPYAPEASHSHGYKTVGYKYPETSVGWYRLKMDFSGKRQDRHYELRFDGIFRDATVWFNGFYMGVEPSGYAVQTYDITPYINFGGENILCIRADATLEEGWFYEGGGIYRNAYLVESGLVHPVQGGIVTTWQDGKLHVSMELENSRKGDAKTKVDLCLKDAEGGEVASAQSLFAAHSGATKTESSEMSVENPHLWDVEDPYLYTLEVKIGNDTYSVPVGLRTAEFTAEDGFLLNGRKLTLKGVNLHQDHAGVGAAMPDGLIEWRVRKMKELGVNAIRCSHNPASPALLDVCDRLGVLVIDENRLMGVNAEHKRLLDNMVRWGRQHPSVILWSVGNEEWGLENDKRGISIVRQMQEYVHLLDPSRQTTAANAGGNTMIEGFQVHGYNYIVQNDVVSRHAAHPEWPIYGSEETTGCGTRGIYFPEEARMPAHNRGIGPGVENVIERGWQFYRDNPWTGGVFFWTGFDYRGEPNPLKYPAHDSEFGILDYCGFPKDEAFYLKAAWTDEPVLHVFPHWNLSGHEGETIDIWAYSNCDEVLLKVNGKSLGRKKMPADGHLSWKAKYKSGKIVATGYLKGKKVVTETIQTTGPAVSAVLSEESAGDIRIVNVELRDKKGRYAPDACPSLTFTLDGPGRILGAGNGDPAYLGEDNPAATDCREFSIPAFNGRAQLIVQGEGRVSVSF